MNKYSSQKFKFIIKVINQPLKFIPLIYETKFELLRDKPNDKQKLGKPIGIKFEVEGTNKILEIASEDDQAIIQLRDFLRSRIN